MKFIQKPEDSFFNVGIHSKDAARPYPVFEGYIEGDNLILTGPDYLSSKWRVISARNTIPYETDQDTLTLDDYESIFAFDSNSLYVMAAACYAPGRWIVAKCPYCGQSHSHQYTLPPGDREALCMKGQYRLVEKKDDTP